MAESEWVTRKRRIDRALRAAGWRIVPERDFDPGRPLSAYEGCAIEEYPTATGPADYALCLAGRIIGVVEAKRLSLGPQNVLVQAERYARGLPEGFDFRGLRAPFLYATNGEVLWHHDVRHRLSRSRRVAHFHTPGALRERLVRDADAALAALARLPNADPRLRPYQREANAAVEAALTERKRAMLVAMATGTGKTFTLVNQVYRLMKSGVARRILFLVDRRALAAQAVRQFASFDAEPGLKFNKVYEVYSQRFQRGDLDEHGFDPKVLPTSYLTDPQPGHAFVYVSTIQRMTINLFGRQAGLEAGEEPVEEDADVLEGIPIHAFDLIIADECHRGYTATQTAIWRRTLDHFDAVKVGLTATPAAHTTSYFRHLVYRYEYERAVREGFLVDYDVVAVKSNVRLQGVFLHEGEQVRLVDPETGATAMDALEDERAFDTAAVEQRVTSPDSNRKILEEIREYALEHEARYGRFPKTLIFAVNDLEHTSHADQLVDLARDVFGRGDSFVEKITGSRSVDRPLQRIREFRNRAEPGIVVTVDMLSTGVDIPDLEYIVFLRPVKSRILFEQMMGRGTRRGEQYRDKSHFVVFDCFDGTLLEYFRKATGITAEAPDKETRSIVEVIQSIWENRDRAYNTRCLVKRLRRIEKEMSGEARESFARYLPAGDVGGFATSLPRRLEEAFTETMHLLRDKQFQDLLVNYQRKPRTFVVAEEHVDYVSSEWRARGADGREYKPGDYLTAFAAFVRENAAEVEALRVLLGRPRAWSTDALAELREKLARAPERFTVENLQAAHKVQYKKALVDIISMVKHAADAESPLWTAGERVELAFQNVTSGKEFSDEQRQWLERIKEHLKENLSIDREDFDALPIFSRHGGWGRANKAFAGRLPRLINEFNEAIAA